MQKILFLSLYDSISSKHNILKIKKNPRKSTQWLNWPLVNEERPRVQSTFHAITIDDARFRTILIDHHCYRAISIERDPITENYSTVHRGTR